MAELGLQNLLSIWNCLLKLFCTLVPHLHDAGRQNEVFMVPPSPSDPHALMLWPSRTWALPPSLSPGTSLVLDQALYWADTCFYASNSVTSEPQLSLCVKCVLIKVLPFPTRSEAEHHTLLKSTCPCTRSAHSSSPDLLCEMSLIPKAEFRASSSDTRHLYTQ